MLRSLLFPVAAFGSLIGSAAADVRLPALFSDHMVLQREMAVPVWGWADPGEEVTVKISGQTHSTKADGDGKWKVTLEAMRGEEAVTMTVEGKNTVTIDDVLVGEVWLASGQSNMQMQVNASKDAQKEKAGAKFPQIRMFTVGRKAVEVPQDQCEGKWVVCSPETVGAFSATAYFFGRDLHSDLKVPVGLINASWGGTAIEAWTSLDVQQGKPEIAPILEQWKRKVEVPYDEAKAAERFEQQMKAWRKQAQKAKAEGKRAPRQPQKPVNPRLHQNRPANLFNGMIAPLIPYAIRGGIWYQGEANAHNNGGKRYGVQLPLMIADWRGRWGQGDFPFAWVQLPNFKEATEDPNAPSPWSLVRESMLKSLTVRNTGMAIAIDAGEAADIHPKNKQVVGKRLGFWALAKVYGREIASSGPLPVLHRVEGSSMVVRFSDTDGGLVAKGGDLKGFAIAGEDRKWVWAEARIDGESVVVSSPDVKAPVAVRYGWSENPACNLYNGAGIPASPFRTDDW